jgi:hypothetical protein
MRRRDFLRTILIGSGIAAFPRVDAGVSTMVKEFHIKLKRFKFIG